MPLTGSETHETQNMIAAFQQNCNKEYTVQKYGTKVMGTSFGFVDIDTKGKIFQYHLTSGGNIVH